MKSLIVRNNSQNAISILIEPWLDTCVIDAGSTVQVFCDTSSDALDVSIDGESGITFETEGDYGVYKDGVELISLQKLRASMPDIDFDKLIESIPKIRPFL